MEIIRVFLIWNISPLMSRENSINTKIKIITEIRDFRKTYIYFMARSEISTIVHLTPSLFFPTINVKATFSRVRFKRHFRERRFASRPLFRLSSETVTLAWPTRDEEANATWKRTRSYETLLTLPSRGTNWRVWRLERRSPAGSRRGMRVIGCRRAGHEWRVDWFTNSLGNKSNSLTANVR